jgi:GNAT superfamily N-acetyltransferase
VYRGGCVLEIYKPTEQDVSDVFVLLQRYATESLQGNMCKPDDEQIVKSLTEIFNSTNFMRLIARRDGKVVGIAFGFIGHTWWKRPCGSIDMFYVDPEERGSGLSRLLVERCIEQFKEFEVGFIWAGSESGMGRKNETLFNNLFLRYGFTEVGGGALVSFVGK